MLPTFAMRIRGLTKTDFDYITSVLDEWWGGPAVQRADPTFFHEFGEHALVATIENDAQVVGFLFGMMLPEHQTRPATGYIHLVGIHPNHRRRGVGQALYSEFFDNCNKAGVSRVKALALEGHEGPLRFHESLGFQAETVPDYAGRARARVVLIKEL